MRIKSRFYEEHILTYQGGSFFSNCTTRSTAKKDTLECARFFVSKSIFLYKRKIFFFVNDITIVLSTFKIWKLRINEWIEEFFDKFIFLKD